MKTRTREMLEKRVISDLLKNWKISNTNVTNNI